MIIADKKRFVVYVSLIAVFVVLVIVKAQMITRGRAKEIVSIFEEWEVHGKPVVVEEIMRKNTDIVTKITAIPSSDTVLVSYVPKTIQRLIRIGQFVTIDGEDSVHGTVTSVGSDVDLQTGMYAVEISFSDGTTLLKQKRYVVGIITRVLESSICIPNESAEISDSEAFVWVVVDGKAEKRTIMVESRDGYGIDIKSGLTDGELLVVEGVSMLDDDDTVTIQKQR